jgi:ribonuclease P protein component
MLRRHRLTGDKRIRELYRGGRSAANDLLVIRLLPNGMDRSRFCIVAGKRVGNAVVRNHTKRRMREVVRSLPVQAGWDAILIARTPAAQADYRRVKRAVENLYRRTGLKSPEPSNADTLLPPWAPPEAVR